MTAWNQRLPFWCTVFVYFSAVVDESHSSSPTENSILFVVFLCIHFPRVTVI